MKKYVCMALLALAGDTRAGDCSACGWDPGRQGIADGVCSGPGINWPATRNFKFSPFDGNHTETGQDAVQAGIADADVRWGTEIISLAQALNPNFTNWGPVKYVFVDEPFLIINGVNCRTVGTCTNATPPPGLAAAWTDLNTKFATVLNAHPTVKTWVNFSFIEIEWWMAGYQINLPSTARVISHDFYPAQPTDFNTAPSCSGGGCPVHAQRNYLNFILTQVRYNHQKMALVPVGFEHASEPYWEGIWPPLASQLTWQTLTPACQNFLHVDYAMRVGGGDIELIAPWDYHTGGTEYTMLDQQPYTQAYLRTVVQEIPYSATCNPLPCPSNFCGYANTGCGYSQFCSTAPIRGCSRVCCDVNLCGSCIQCVSNQEYCN